MNNKGVTFIPPKPSLPKFNIQTQLKGLTASLSNYNRPKCGCGKSKVGYCDGSHATK